MEGRALLEMEGLVGITMLASPESSLNLAVVHTSWFSFSPGIIKLL